MNVNLRKLQLKALEILCEVDRICKKNNINYSLIGGSAIGAILYKGFLPWDDDIDIVMDRTNFNKFKKVCQSQLPEQYKFQDYVTNPETKTLVAKVTDTSVKCIIKNDYGEKIESGIWVDITVFDVVPVCKISMVSQKLMLLVVLLYINQISPVNHGKLINLIGNVLLKITPKKYQGKVIITFLKQMTKYKRTEKTYLDEVIVFNIPRVYLPPDSLDEFIYFEFEGYQFPLFKNYHNYLIKRYKRDYTIPIDKELQRPHHNIEYIDFGDSTNKEGEYYYISNLKT